jgi:hypothetical protein
MKPRHDNRPKKKHGCLIEKELSQEELQSTVKFSVRIGVVKDGFHQTT